MMIIHILEFYTSGYLKWGIRGIML